METTHASSPPLLPPLIERARQQANALEQDVLVRLPDPRTWKDPWAIAAFALQSGEASTLWADPNGRMLAVGIGEALTLTAQGDGRLGALQHELQQTTARTFSHDDLRALPLWFGGFAFRSSTTPSEDGWWSGWEHDRFTTHAITAIHTPQRNWTILTLRITPHQSRESIAQYYEQLRQIVETMYTLAADLPANPHTPLSFTSEFPREDWFAHVEDATASIAQGTLQKVVIARRMVAPWPTADDTRPVPARLDASIRLLRQRYAHCTTFALSTPKRANTPSTFFGATPELLIGRQDGRIQTMALAGTAPRGADVDEDRQREYELLGSSKEREEHDLVRQDIVAALAQLDIEVRASSVPDVVSFPNVHHLCTPIHAPAPEHVGILEIASALHPTPAVCGTPGTRAFDWLQAHENLDRGWYAGGVGWLSDRLDGRICVALRSAIATEAGVAAFAGAGIVEGSEAAREWEETHAKLAPIRDALEGQPSAPSSSPESP